MAALEPVFLEAPAQISGQELRIAALEGLQEGVVGAGDLKVTAGGGTREVVVAAGVVLIQGDAVTDQGLYRARNDANVSSNTSTAGSFEAGGIPAADATNPRIDQIVARVYDASHDGSGQRKWRPEVIAGTATSGATLDNRTGAAALPAGACRLADVLVPAGATTILAANVRDRRPWARGAYRRIQRNTNASSADDYTTTSTSYVLIDSTNLQPRIECSGAPLSVSLRGTLAHLTAGGSVDVTAAVDGASLADRGRRQDSATAGANAAVGIMWDLVPAAGSHLVGPMWKAGTTGTIRWLVRAANDIELVVEEKARQNADNT